MKKISKQQVTASLDRMANLFQTHGKQLGIPSRVAFDFAYRCDLLSDALDKMAAEDEEEKEEEVEEEEESSEEEEKESSKKAKLSRAAALRKLDRLYAKIAADEEEESEEEEEEEEKESSKKARLSRAAAIRELDRLHRKATRGSRRTRRFADFDPNEIGEEGKDEAIEADEEYMEDFDGNTPHHELSEMQEKGDLGKAARRHRANHRRANRRTRR